MNILASILLSTFIILTSCTPAKVDYSLSLFNNLKYEFSSKNISTQTTSIYLGQTTSVSYSTSDIPQQKTNINLTYEVTSPNGHSIDEVLETYPQTITLESGQKNFEISLKSKSSLSFTENSKFTIKFSTDDDSLNISPSTIEFTVINETINTSSVTLSSTDSVNNSNKTNYTLSGTCTDLTDFIVKINSSPSTVTCSSNTWSLTLDLSSYIDGSLSFQATNSDSSITFHSSTIVKDTIAPFMLSLDDQAYYNSLTSAPLTSWSANDPNGSGVIKYLIAIGSSSLLNDDVMAWTDIGLVTSHQASGLSLGEGSTYFTNIKAIDAAGNSSNILTSDGWIVDTITPTASLIGNITSPNNNTVFSGTVNSTDVSYYQYKIGTTGSTFCSNSLGYSSFIPIATPISQSLTGIPDGSVSLCLIAKDAAGNIQNYATASVYTWVKDTTLPTLSITNPSNNSYTNTTNYTAFGVTSSCSEEGVTVSITAIDSNLLTTSTKTNTCTSGYASVSFNFSGFTEGNITIQSSQTDIVGNVGQSPSITVIKDTISPSLAGLSDGVYFSSTSSSPLLSWSAAFEAGSGVHHYEVQLGTSSGASDVMGWTNISNVTSKTISGLALTSGVTYYPSLQAIDNAGNTSTASLGDGWLADTSLPSTVINFNDMNFGSSTETPLMTWSPSSDTGSGVLEYKMALGTTPGGTDVRGWTSLGNTTSGKLTGLSLTNGLIYYPSILSIDKAGNQSSNVYLDGFRAVSVWKDQEASPTRISG
ncbi:MAG: hypothetical protein KDD45_02270, partial [Bdellovibrionales bacterium]|nr:hypothetical protein [Bdellovibrionales bacterium]